MSRELNELKNYSNQDYAEVHKHWSTFISPIGKSIVNAVGAIIASTHIKGFLDLAMDELQLNVGDTDVVAMADKFIIPAAIVWALLFTATKLIPAVMEYMTCSLEIDNVWIKGSIGAISAASIHKKLESCEIQDVSSSLLGRMLGYGSMVIKIGGECYSIRNMENIDKFQELFNNFKEASRMGRERGVEQMRGEVQLKQTQIQANAMVESARIRAEGYKQFGSARRTPELTDKNHKNAEVVVLQEKIA